MNVTCPPTQTKRSMRLKGLIRVFLALLVALTISCRGKGATQLSEFPEQKQTLPATITLVNWNAQKGKNPQFSEDLKLILEQEKPDLVFLQIRHGSFDAVHDFVNVDA